TSLHGIQPSFAYVASEPVHILDPRNEKQRRQIHPFIALVRDVVYYDHGKYKRLSLDSAQLFFFNGYKRSKDNTLVKLSPVETGVARTYWWAQEMPSPWAILKVHRKFNPAEAFVGRSTEVTLTLSNVGGHPIRVPGFRDELPEGVENAGSSPSEHDLVI